MQTKIKMISISVMTILFVLAVLGVSFVFLPRGYFEIVLVTVAVLAWIIEHFVVKKYVGKKADK